VRLVRAHLEEDAGKSLHEDFIGQSGIDLNRAGTPLLEIVTEPDMRSSLEAVAYAKELHKIVTWIGICDGNMQEGSFRCDANVSVRKPGDKFGTRREIKNLNSFKFMQQAIDYEVRWQIEQIEDGHTIEQATVLFNPDTGETRSMRTKEDAADYRYFPDPDLPPLVIADEWVARVRSEMTELPRVMAARFVADFGLSEYDATQLTQSREMAAYFEAAEKACGQAKLVSNWMMGEVSRRLNQAGLTIKDIPVAPQRLGWLINSIQTGVISNNGGKALLEGLWNDSKNTILKWQINSITDGTSSHTGANALLEHMIDKLGLRQSNDTGELEAIIDTVLASNAKSVEEYKAGNAKAFNALVGQAMKATKGKGNPAQVNELLKKKLG
jgi:aspartyl-tRNA(Asn)/glutamyl-tRNA(Gln) amidotransferase subunit B